MNANTLDHNHVIFLALIAVILFGSIDYISGRELGFFVFYFLPIMFTAWYNGLKSGVFIAIVSAIAWYGADAFCLNMNQSVFYSLWNMLIRLIAFLLIAFFTSKTSHLLIVEREISQQLKKSLEQLKILRGFLPICSSCKKIRNDEGYWEQIEKYIQEHSEADFTHGICDECAHRLYPSLYQEK